LYNGINTFIGIPSGQEVEVDNPIVNQVLKDLNALPYNLQQQVLDFVHALRLSSQNGVPGSQLLRFAGAISDKDLEKMSQAIEEGCEQVESNEW
jgi:hypothetical protein